MSTSNSPATTSSTSRPGTPAPGLAGFLKSMNKAIPTDAEVTVELGEEFPVKLHYQIAEGMGTITYMLAPRIQSD